jgi:hypothetical protein
MGIHLRLPADWHVVRHSLKPELGKLDLVDRRRARLTLSWTQCKSPPDLDRLISDYQDRERLDQADAKVEPLRRLGHWRGFRRAEGEGKTSHRAVRYDSKTARLIELLLLSYRDDDRASDLVDRVLGSVELCASTKDVRRWCAFGVDVKTPQNFRLVALKVEPGDVSFSFAEFSEAGSKPTGAAATIRRLGLVESWHNDDLRGLVIANQKSTRFSKFEPIRQSQAPALLASGVQRVRPLRRVLGGLPQHRVLAWRSPSENAIYELSTSAKMALSPFEFEVRAATLPPGMGPA